MRIELSPARSSREPVGTTQGSRDAFRRDFSDHLPVTIDVKVVPDEVARSTAGIVCFTVAPRFRGNRLQERVLAALKPYGSARGWTSIEAYPFADETIAKQGPALRWPGLSKNYERAGFKRVGEHWLSQPGFERHLYSVDLRGAV